MTKTKLARAVGQRARRRASETIATIRPPGVTRKQFEVVKAIQREARAGGERDVRRAVTRSNSLLGRLGAEEQRTVIDAIESGNIAQLKGTARPATLKRRERIRGGVGARKTRQDPDRLYKVALQIRSDIRYLNRIGRRSGLIGGQRGVRSRTREEVRLGARTHFSERAYKTQRARLDREFSVLTKRHRIRVGILQKRADDAERRYFNYAETTGPGPDAKRTRLKKEVVAAKAAADDARAEAGQAISEARVARREATKRMVTGARQAQAYKEELKRVRRGRFETEARGYFPRASAAELKARGGLLSELEREQVPVRPASAGARQPKAGAGRRRKYLKPQAALREGTKKERARAEQISEDVRGTLAGYGGQVARGAAAKRMNVEIAAALGERVPRNITREGLAELEAQGKQVFRLHRGDLQPMTASNFGQIRRGSLTTEQQVARAIEKGPRKGKGAAAQYVVLPRNVERLAREKGELWGADKGALAAFDYVQRGWKGLALATPGYLVRNLLGDTFNATTHENPFVLARNFARGQKALNALGKQERALRRFERALPEDKRTIKLTEEQAHAFARLSTSKGMPAVPKQEVSAMEVALAAEKMGVIRQGRFLELMEEAGKLPKPKGTHVWQDATKRVEDSMRIATFLGGLQRGFDPRQAATRASKIHFDYGDLSSIEKSVFRRAMPFYTFSARNLPFQAKTFATRPGAYAAVQRAREQGRAGTDLPAGYEEMLNPYEARQLALPIKWGDETKLVSVGSPFVDLNEVTAGVGALARGEPIAAGRIGLQKGLDMASVFAKLPIELMSNHSFFYRDEIQHTGEPLTRAPAWAIELGKVNKRFAKKTGLVNDYVPTDGKQTWGWGRKADYAFRQAQPGPLSALVEIVGGGVKGRNARDLSRVERILTDLGVRAAPYERQKNEINQLYDARERLEGEAEILRRRAGPSGKRISADNATKRYDQIREEMSRIEDELARLGAGSRKPTAKKKTSDTLPLVTESAPAGGGLLPLVD